MSTGSDRAADVRTVLVTGADGTIGRATVRRLKADGWRVVALSRAFAEPTEADVSIEGDATRESDVVHALKGVDAVVHLAALPHWESGTPYEVYSTNVVSTFTVLTHAAIAGVRRCVIASSIHASGIPANRHPDIQMRFPIDETLQPAHDDWYSLSKYSDELTAAMVASRWGTAVIALRFPLVNTTEKLLEFGREWERSPEEGAKLGWCYLHVDDAAEAVRSALLADTTGAVVLQLAAPEILLPHPTDELLDRYAPLAPRAMRFPGRMAPVDTSRARALLGFDPVRRVDITAPEPAGGVR